MFIEQRGIGETQYMKTDMITLERGRSHIHKLNDVSDVPYIHLKDFYEFITENSTDVIFQTTSTGIITYMSSSLNTLAGYNPSEIIGKRFTNFVPKREIPRYIARIQEMLSGRKISNFESTIKRKDGLHRSVEFSGMAVQRQGKRYINGIMRDISERKQTQEMLKKINEELEKKVKERTIELQDSYNALKSLNVKLEDKVLERTAEIQKILKQKDEFINQLGHDLKNPLGPLINLIPLLKQHEKAPKFQEMLEIVERNTLYMRNLISHTLSLARLNSPNTRFHFETINIYPIIQNVLNANKMLFEEKHVKIHTDLPKNLEAPIDKLQFEELLTNLITNAVKYSSDQGHVHLISQKEDSGIIVSIKDEGRGMTVDQVSHVFDEFYKVEYAHDEFHSSGLGLTIAKRIVEKHGGKIWAESGGLGRGSTFFFTLPKSQGIIQHTDIQDLDDMDHEVTRRIDILMDTRLKE